MEAIGLKDSQVMESRYAYYRRCQMLRRNGEQCKAPAETGAHICYAHARQFAMQERRADERRAVLEEAALEMQRRGRSGFKAADIGLDFKAIQVTIATMAKAIIEGRIDCRTAGRLVVELQTASKLLWMKQRARRRSNFLAERGAAAPAAEPIQGLKPRPITRSFGRAEAPALTRSVLKQSVTVGGNDPAEIINFPIALSTSLMPRAA